ncbi:MAG: hypothetical protein JOY64_20140 [Alphaproteobacteria bacterium]|nr:hypothetical protein [Alphaproteobacteria bacterium]
MSTSIADERRLLAAEEYEPVARSHHPALASLTREELLDLVRWLREQRGKHRRHVERHRRAARGKAEPGTPAAAPAGERGMAAKKQVFARALKRVNARLDGLLAAEKRAAMRAGHEAALARKRRQPRHHPSSGDNRPAGPSSIENPKGADIVQGSVIGSISEANREAQARRDNRES